MKALSIKQPWASMIAEGYKTIETRTWTTPYRGELLIVSSKGPMRADLSEICDISPAFALLMQNVPYGQALAVAELVECRPMTREDAKAAMCGVYYRAQAWVLQNIRKIEPFPVRGQLGIYNVNLPNGVKYL